METKLRRTLMAAALVATEASSLWPVGAGAERWQGAPPTGVEIIIDNAQAQVTGNWIPSTYKPDYYGQNYLYARSGTGASRVVWRPSLNVGGTYDVYYRLPDGSPDRASDAVFTIYHAAGQARRSVDQRLPGGGEWRLLGGFVFQSGTAGAIELTDQASGTYVIADAVKFVPVTSTVVSPAEVVVDNDAALTSGAWSVSNSRPNHLGQNYLFRASGGTGANWVRWTPHLLEPGRYFVYCRLPDGLTNRAPDAPYLITSDSVTQLAHVDERQASNGEWIPLSSFVYAAGTSAFVELSDQATGTYIIADAIKFVRTDHTYTIRTDLPRQTILGLGVEIQADSIGSGNVGLPQEVSGVPHDLVPSERTRFYTELLRGFRYVRLALGLYLRGLTPDRRNIVERYPNQMSDLREMIQASGMEGASVEYWSPAPYWKNSDSLIGGSLRQFDDQFLSAFGDAVVDDLDYLVASGVPITMFGLQNEPKYSYNKPYSYTPYTDQQYYDTFRHVAPKVRAAHPNVLIHDNSQAGQNGIGSRLIQGDAEALSHVDAWTWHRMGVDSTEQITDRLTFNSNTFGRPVFNNEFEYLSGGTNAHRMVNTAQSVMNWLTFENSPTWFWLHALKPTYNSEAEGFGLGLWRPYDDNDFSKYSHINKGHFDYIKTNWHAVAGFLTYMPWNSVRYHVDEGVRSPNHRIMAWRSPTGKLTIALTNRTTAAYTFDIAVVGVGRQFTGYRYDAARANVPLGAAAGTALRLAVPSYSIEFWVED